MRLAAIAHVSVSAVHTGEVEGARPGADARRGQGHDIRHAGMTEELCWGPRRASRARRHSGQADAGRRSSHRGPSEEEMRAAALEEEQSRCG